MTTTAPPSFSEAESPAGTVSERPSPAAKIRILEAATVLFAHEGIRAVGVDRLIQHSSVTKATFYKHFGSKDKLIRDYLDAASARTLLAIDTVFGSADSPEGALTALADHVHEMLLADELRGSVFVNAAAEFPDPRDPVRVIVAEHHEAISERFTRVLTELGHAMPGEASDELMMSYVGALAWGHVADPIGASVAFRRSVERLVLDARS